MNDELDDTPSVLAVGARLANLARRARSTTDAAKTDAISVTEVATGQQAMALLRVVPFDLVAVGPWLIDTSAERFAVTLRQAKPWQKWVSVHDADADNVADHDGTEPSAAVTADANLDEIAARTLGATAVLEGGPDAWPQLVELARQVRRREPARTVPGLAIAARQAELNRSDFGRPARTPAAI